MASSISRNGPCPCGSGHKYKKCCAAQAPFKVTHESLSDEVAAYALRLTRGADLLKEYERNQARMPAEAGMGGLMNVPAIIWMKEALGQPIPEALAALQRRLTAAIDLE